MADERDQGAGGVRRVSPRDRKSKIDARDLSFPPDSLPQEPRSDVEETQPYSEAHEPEPLPPPKPARTSRSEARAERFPPLPDQERPPARPQRRRVQPAAAARRRRGSPWRDAIALLFILGALAAGAYFIFIWNNPYSPLNPLAPPLPPPVIVSETPLPTSTPTVTLTHTPRPTATFTALPAEQIAPLPATIDPLATPDATLTLLAGTPSATPPPPPFALIRSGILFRANASTAGCRFAGIAGSVVDFDGRPLNDYIVWVTGEAIDSRLLSGSDNTYGAGGFLIQVAEEPVAQPFAVQLLAPDGVTPLSEPYTFLTRDVCEYNVALVRFIQVREF